MGYHGNKVPNPLTPSLPAAALRTMGVSSAHRLRYILEGEREEGVRGKGRGGGGKERMYTCTCNTCQCGEERRKSERLTFSGLL